MFVTSQKHHLNFLKHIVFGLFFLFLLVSNAISQTAARVELEAWLINGGQRLDDGVEWRIFNPTVDQTGSLPLLGSAIGGSSQFEFAPGEYIVHATYGHASAVRKISVSPTGGKEIFIFNAGGLKLNAVAGFDTPILPSLLRFDVFDQKIDARGRRQLIARNVKPSEIVPFPEGTYHVVSKYGNLNAEVRADIRVKAGQVTNAQMVQRAARVTLRLVREADGDALANTAWSVLNESGDLITESTSAFPNIVLSEGNYSAIAKNNDKIFSKDFVIKAGIDRDVEVLVEG